MNAHEAFDKCMQHEVACARNEADAVRRQDHADAAHWHKERTEWIRKAQRFAGEHTVATCPDCKRGGG